MAGTPFPVNPVLTGIAIAYKNNKLIADDVLPRLEPRFEVDTFKWWKFDFNQFITLPDTQVGRKSSPNEVEFNAIEVQDVTLDYGLDDLVPNSDIKKAPAGYDPLAFATQKIMDMVLLDREVRTANKVFNAANYAASNKAAPSGTDKWSDPASKPIIQITQAMDTMIIRPNKMAIGRIEWTTLRTNPSVLRATSAYAAADGMASKQAVADLLELDDIIIGEGFINTAKKGQTAVMARAWKSNALLFHSAPLASSIDATPTFGWTAQFGDRVAGSIPEPKIGLRGSERVRAGESVKEVVSAWELGYLFQNVI